MSTTTFTNGVTLTDAGWFNDVDAAAYEGTFPSGPTAITVTGATTLAVFNTIATTVNAFGAASVALNIGHASAAAAFAGGISIPTGKNVTGTGTAQVTGFATVSATTLTGTLSTAAQTNITSVGTLTGLVLGGNVTESGGSRSITVTGAITGAAISGTTGTFSGTITQTQASAEIRAGTTTTYGFIGNSGATSGIITYGSAHATLAHYVDIYVNTGTTALRAASTGAVTIPGTLGVTGATELGTGNSALSVASGGVVNIGSTYLASGGRSSTNPTNAISLFNGTAPAGTLTNGVTLYAAAGKLWAMDAAGNATKLTP